MVDPVTIAAGVKAATGLASALGIGGTSQGKAVRNTRKQQEKLTRSHPSNVRYGAELAGFNPLTYMMANGSPGTVSGVGDGGNLGGWGLMAEGFSDLAAAMSTDATEEETKKAADRQLDRVKRDQERVKTVVRETSRLVTQPLAVPAAAPNNASVAQSVSPPAAPAVAAQTEAKRPGLDPQMSPVPWSLEEAKVEPVRDVPLTSRYRTGIDGGQTYVGLNPDAWEIGVGELIGGGLIHAGAWAASKAPVVREYMATLASREAEADDDFKEMMNAPIQDRRFEGSEEWPIPPWVKADADRAKRSKELYYEF